MAARAAFVLAGPHSLHGRPAPPAVVSSVAGFHFLYGFGHVDGLEGVVEGLGRPGQGGITPRAGLT